MSVEVTEYLCNSGGDNFTETGLRPPALGGEDQEAHSTKSSNSRHSQRSQNSIKSNHGDSHLSPAMTPRRSKLLDGKDSGDAKAVNSSAVMGFSGSCGNLDNCEPPLGFEPEGSASTTPPFTETNTPPFIKWAENLQNLLEDVEGVELFKRYLQQEQCQDSLNFWFACEGLKKNENIKQMHQLIKVIHRKYLRTSNATLAVSAKTRKIISDKIATKLDVDQHIFDEAQAEVESSINATTYPNFLKSDIYLQHVQLMQNGGGESPKMESFASSSSESRLHLGTLATVEEDKELQITDSATATLPLTHRHLQLTQGRRAGCFDSQPKPEAFAGQYLQHSAAPQVPNPYHAMYGSCVPVSAQDSELQSLSSDAHTDDTMSLTDSSVDGFPIYPNKKYFRQQRHAMCHNANQNRENDPNHGFIPRGFNLPKEQRIAMEPSKFASILIEKLEVLKRNQETQEKLHESLHKFPEGEEETVSLKADEPSNRLHPFASLPMGLLKMQITDDSDQSILDEHVNRIWNDSTQETPSRSPRSHSPERRRTSAPPSLGGLGTTYPSRPSTLPLHAGMNSSHHRHRKDKDNSSTLSSDSGTVHNFDEGDSVPSPLPGSVPPSMLSHHKHSHHHVSKSKLVPAQARLMPVDSLDLAAKVGYVEPYTNLPGNALADRDKRTKETCKRANNKKTVATDSSSSGVSVSYEPPSSSSRERVLYWMMGNESRGQGDYEKDSSTRHRKSSQTSLSTTSPVAVRQGRVKKPVQYNTSRSGSLERSNHLPWLQPSQPFVQDPSMPMLPPPNTTTQLEEARRRLEDDTKAKLSKSKSGLSSKDKLYPDLQKPRSLGKGISMPEVLEETHSTMRKFNKKCSSTMSSSAVQNAPDADYTVVGYYFCGDSVPYRCRIPGKNVTLRQFKSLIAKRGNYRYFFKKACDEFGTGVVHEEITDDDEILPVWEGKIFGQVQSVD